MFLKYGRATHVFFPRAFTQCCLNRRMQSHLREADGLLHLGVTSDKNGISCQQLMNRAYWKTQIIKFYELLRAENMVVAFLHPRVKELAYFSRVQRVACYTMEVFLTFMVCFLLLGEVDFT